MASRYSTHVTSYLKEMQSRVGLGAAAQGVSAGISAGVGVGGGGGGPADGGFVCLQSALCEGRYASTPPSQVVMPPTPL